MRIPLTAALALALATLPGAKMVAQPKPDTTEAVKVFLDCQFECDSNFLRLEINYVNWVLDRTDADVHILVASQATGGGGRSSTLRFIGLRRFQGLDDELNHTTNATATADENRNGQAQVIRLGLIRYLARTAVGRRLIVSAPDAATAAAQGRGLKPRDPWGNWVFTVSGSTFLNGESRQQFANINGRFNAKKTLDDWKFLFELSGSRNSSKFVFEDSTGTTEFSDKTATYSAETFVAKSLGDHWSAGINLDASQSTRSNIDLTLRTGPSVEYNFFKYSEATRKRLTALYEINVVHSDYAARTIFGKVQEVRIQQSLGVGGQARQPWGDVSGTLTGTAYLDDWSKNNVSLFGSMNLRVTKGLDFNLFGSYSRVRDQLNLPAGGASRDEILRQLRELKTSYRYFASFGLTYRFGSIYNNVVNPRFSRRDGEGRFFFF